MMATSEQFLGKRTGPLVIRNSLVLPVSQFVGEIPAGRIPKGVTEGVLHRRAWGIKNSADQVGHFVRNPKRGDFKGMVGMFDAYKVRDLRGPEELYSAFMWNVPNESEEKNDTHTYIDLDLHLLISLLEGAG